MSNDNNKYDKEVFDSHSREIISSVIWTIAIMISMWIVSLFIN